MSFCTENERIERARAVSIKHELERRGAWSQRLHNDAGVPCPSCGGHDRFAVNVRKNVFICRKSDVGGDAIALVQHLDNCGFLDAVTTLLGDARSTQRTDNAPRAGLGFRSSTAWSRQGLVATTPSQPEVGPGAALRSARAGNAYQSISPRDEAARIRGAVAIWEDCSHPSDTIVEIYLRKRLLDIPWEAAGESLRFHAACPWREEETGKTIFVPAMVAAMRSIETGEIVGIHRTRLTPDGRKVDRRMLGKASGSAIMLCPYTAIGGSLAIGEGIETCLAGWQLGWSNAWALGSVGAIANFPLLGGLDTLVVFAETGAASARAVDQVGARYHDAGRQVVIVEPRFGSDLNDAIRSEAA